MTQWDLLQGSAADLVYPVIRGLFIGEYGLAYPVSRFDTKHTWKGMSDLKVSTSSYVHIGSCLRRDY
jgi:hypothetical protein